jgi:hypothetical protein
MPIFPSWSAVTSANPASWLAASSMASWTDPAWSAMAYAAVMPAPPQGGLAQGDLAGQHQHRCAAGLGGQRADDLAV